MITTSGRQRQQAVSVDGGPPVAVIDYRNLRYALEGQDYVVRQAGDFPRGYAYQLWRVEDHLASLRGHWLHDRYTLTEGGREWSLRRDGFLASRYVLFAAEDRVGEVKRAGHWGRMDLIADLPADVPTDIQVFLVWFALYKFALADD